MVLPSKLESSRSAWIRPSNAEAITSKFTSGLPELGGYLGIPLLIILVIVATTMRPGRARRGVWMLLLAAFVADLLAAGPVMKENGHRLGQGPWALIQHLPALGAAIPVRLAMYAILFIALAVALWLAAAPLCAQQVPLQDKPFAEHKVVLQLSDNKARHWLTMMR